MNKYSLESINRTKKYILIALIAFSNMVISQVGPQPSSFGVWDRGEAMDIKQYPFLKGTSCDFPGMKWRKHQEYMTGQY